MPRTARISRFATATRSCGAPTPALFERARQQAAKTRQGQTAPLAAIDAVGSATTLPFDAGCTLEAELFNRYSYSSRSKSLIHAFFAEREVSKIPGVPKDAPVYEIRRAAVIGAGTMGGGILHELRQCRHPRHRQGDQPRRSIAACPLSARTTPTP